MDYVNLLISITVILTPHITYYLLTKKRTLINQYIWVLSNKLIWLAYIPIAYYTIIYTNERYNVFNILTFYLVMTYVITRIRFNADYFNLGIMVSMFQSEYWEIPIQLFWGDTIDLTYQLLAVSKMLCIIEIIYLLNRNGLDELRFAVDLVKFTVPYYALVILVYPLNFMRGTYMFSDFIFRTICSVFFIWEINRVK
jgi:hypothetical protein